MQPAGHFRRTDNEVFVANIKSQIKRNKQNEVEDRDRNKAVKSELRTRTKNAIAPLVPRTKSRPCARRSSASTWPASKGIIHKNQAANKKSGLMKRIATLRNEA